MEYECAVISLIYLARMISYSNGIFHLDETNYRGVLLACMVVATKVWDDFGMLNSGYTQIFPGLLLQRVNELETQLLHALRFDLWITIKEFTFYHFLIQDLITKDELKKYRQEVIKYQLAAMNSDDEADDGEGHIATGAAGELLLLPSLPPSLSLPLSHSGGRQRWDSLERSRG
jgi:hypothetical protein